MGIMEQAIMNSRYFCLTTKEAVSILLAVITDGNQLRRQKARQVNLTDSGRERLSQVLNTTNPLIRIIWNMIIMLIIMANISSIWIPRGR